MAPALKTPTTSPASPVREVDLLRLSHLSEAPSLAPLVSERVVLHTRLQDLQRLVIETRRDLAQLEQHDWPTLSTRRQVETQLHALIDEGAQIETALRSLHAQIATEEARLKQHLVPLLAVEGHGVVTDLVEALTHLEAVIARYTQFAAHAQRLCGSRMVPSPGLFGQVAACLRQAHKDQARLAQFVTEQEG